MINGISPTPLDGLWEIETRSHGDERGRFTRLFCAETFSVIRPDLRFVQVNHSVTALRGTVRGLHFQRAPMQESKLVRCLRGRVFDVAVDLRPESPSFGQWHGVELAEDNDRALFIPEGFAHGFQSLTDDAHLLYQHTTPHAPAHEGGVYFADPTLAIRWPLTVTLVSDRDAAQPLLRAAVARLAA